MSSFRKRNVRGTQKPTRLSFVADRDGDVDEEEEQEDEEGFFTSSIHSQIGKPFSETTGHSSVPKRAIRSSLEGSSEQRKVKPRFKRSIGASTAAMARTQDGIFDHVASSGYDGSGSNLAYSKEKLSELRKKSVRSSRKFMFVKEQDEGELMDVDHLGIRGDEEDDEEDREAVGPGYTKKDIERLKREKQRRREELAKKEAGKDFIALRSDSTSMDVESPAHVKGLEESSERSSSGDESDGETVYHRKGKRILYAFGYSADDDEGAKVREDGKTAFVDPALEMDEDAWEEEQLRTSGAKVDAQTKRIIHEQKQKEREKEVFDSYESVRVDDHVVDSVLEDMKKSLNELEKVQLGEEREMLDLEAQLEDACMKLENVEKSSKSAEEQCIYFKKLHKYFIAFSDCMEEKLKLINGCEQRVKDMWRRHGTRLSVRRRWIQNNVLQHAGLQSAFPVLSSKDVDDEIKESALHQYQNWSAIDLFLDAETPLQRESSSFKMERDAIHQDASRIFDDVDEEYCSIERVAERFVRWKRDNAESFTMSFGSMILPMALGPLVRFEMLFVPFSISDVDAVVSLSEMPWFVALRNAEREMQIDSESIRKELGDDDAKTPIASVIESVVLPWIVDWCSTGWNVFSWNETDRIRKVLRFVKECIFMDEASVSQQYEVALRTISTRILVDAISEVEWSIPIEQRGAILHAPHVHQIGMKALRLFQTLCMFEEIIPIAGDDEDDHLGRFQTSVVMEHIIPLFENPSIGLPELKMLTRCVNKQESGDGMFLTCIGPHMTSLVQALSMHMQRGDLDVEARNTIAHLLDDLQ
eukprot:TRINITY_DN381_c0_g2_i1.p2 TRINITY_DN381_c0_g2~~TRINITY_DN381_c0_g2_i1.p2  ORF type:complete len:814 (-),score=274.24 TRINITY_DN381_c0_g2_i1:3527-5968(-)